MNDIANKNMVEFKTFAKAIHDNYSEMQSHELFTVDADKDEIWEVYLNAFPAGTNEIFRERREHDCSCCKNFIRNLGAVVAIINGAVRSVWDSPDVGWPYDVVSEKMLEYVQSRPINRIFRTKEASYGAEMTPELIEGKTHRWNHFHGDIAAAHKMQGPHIGPYQSRMEAAYQVMSRGLAEITRQSISDVEDLITQGAIYRGEEHSQAILGFKQLMNACESAEDKELFLWQNLNEPAARFRNTVIGTLMTDLSTGVPLEDAVKMFESKVAPANYKRSKALITPAMIDKALDKLDSLGLRQAIERRHAKISDVSVNDVLFVDNEVAPLMRDALKDSLMTQARATKVNVDNATAISVEDFLADVLPECVSLKALLATNHLSRFMSVTAPVQEDSGNLFSWGNDFAWSYDGDFTDSVKQRVRKAGGNVEADFRMSLSWFNYDDLDIHCKSPMYGHISFSDKQGKLDVDMNAGGRNSREAVENIAINNPEDGTYQVYVNQYSERESVDKGFELEIEFYGEMYRYFSESSPTMGRNSSIVTIQVKDRKITLGVAGSDLREGSSTQEKWGVKTGQLVPVNALVTSPNHWNGKTQGNKHWFFLLKDCLNPDPVRGIYNEFLTPSLLEHRKVFEVLGAKTKAPYSDEQLSGVGFSSTQRESLTVVTQSPAGKGKAYNINF